MPKYIHGQKCEVNNITKKNKFRPFRLQKYPTYLHKHKKVPLSKSTRDSLINEKYNYFKDDIYNITNYV